DALAAAEQVQKLPVPSVLGILQRWTYDLLSAQLAAAPAPRYFPREQAVLARCAQASDAHRLQAFLARLVTYRRSENHPLAARLVMEAVFLEYRQLFQ
ncbi:DNA polymerase III subunit delta', partial [Cupriavidus basilensis]|nr:DNA polymerase III subunit delta' [Cupriavidus basilensis]